VAALPRFLRKRRTEVAGILARPGCCGRQRSNLVEALQTSLRQLQAYIWALRAYIWRSQAYIWVPSNFHLGGADLYLGVARLHSGTVKLTFRRCRLTSGSCTLTSGRCKPIPGNRMFRSSRCTLYLEERRSSGERVRSPQGSGKLDLNAGGRDNSGMTRCRSRALPSVAGTETHDRLPHCSSEARPAFRTAMVPRFSGAPAARNVLRRDARQRSPRLARAALQNTRQTGGECRQVGSQTEVRRDDRE